jgi:hypothetical protein
VLAQDVGGGVANALVGVGEGAQQVGLGQRRVVAGQRGDRGEAGLRIVGLQPLGVEDHLADPVELVAGIRGVGGGGDRGRGAGE